jgi:5-methylcytosine-specific restriction endonuclease McrA
MTGSILSGNLRDWIKNNPEKVAENKAAHYARVAKQLRVGVSMEEYYASIAKEALQERVAKDSADAFLHSDAWKQLRQQVLVEYGHVCMRCGSRHRIQVDHIKPRSKYPALALTFSNLQVLCWNCNKDKAARYEKDFRKSKQFFLPMSQGQKGRGA